MNDYIEFIKSKIDIAPETGLFTVPERAIRLGRKVIGIELNAGYFDDGVGYCEAAEAHMDMPTLFDFLGKEQGVAI